MRLKPGETKSEPESGVVEDELEPESVVVAEPEPVEIVDRGVVGVDDGAGHEQESDIAPLEKDESLEVASESLKAKAEKDGINIEGHDAVEGETGSHVKASGESDEEVDHLDDKEIEVDQKVDRIVDKEIEGDEEVDLYLQNIDF